MYIEHNVIHETAQFTEDHFPPQSVGGRQKALVCKDCNSNLGSAIDSSLKTVGQWNLFLQQEGKVKIGMQFEGLAHSYNLDATWNDNGDLLLTDLNTGNYFASELAKTALYIKKTEPFKFRLRMLLPSEKLVRLAILKAAFLQFFTVMGYEFAYSEVAGHIRRVLFRTEEHVLSDEGVLYDIQQNNLPAGCYLVTTNDSCKFFLVSMNIQRQPNESPLNHFVIIPTMQADEWNTQRGIVDILSADEIDCQVYRIRNSMQADRNPLLYSSLSR